MIEIKVDGQIVSVQKRLPLYSGSADIQNCHFVFGSGWNGFEKSAVFRVGSEIHTKLIDDEGCCAVPWELLTQKNVGGQLEVGVYGVAADTEIMTSVWDTLGMIREGTEPGGDARNPVDGIYEQILSKVGQISEKVSLYDENVLALTRRAETAAGFAGESAQSVKDDLEELRVLLEEHGGIPGDSPYIGENGNWWIGDLDTGVKAQGVDGKDAYAYAKDGGYGGTEEEFQEKLAVEAYTKSEADDKFLPSEGGTITGDLTAGGSVAANSFALAIGATLKVSGADILLEAPSGRPITIRPYANTAHGVSFSSNYMFPETTDKLSLGKSTRKFKNLYLVGNITNGTNTVAVSDIAKKSELPATETWTFTLQNGTTVTKVVCVQ